MPFPATRWSVVCRASQSDGVDGARALAELVTAYRRPLFVWARRSGYDPPAADDLVQDFFAMLIASHSLASFDPDRGRFRIWLLSAVRHHAARVHARATAAKRGGNATTLAFDAELVEATVADVAATSPEEAFHRTWARALLERVRERLRGEYVARNAEREFDALAPSILRDEPARHDELARTLEKSTGAVKVAVHRLRKRYAETLRLEIAETLADPTPLEIEKELRALIDSLRAVDR